MTAFAARVLRTVRAQGLVSPGARVGVAVSGGPDSTALLLVLLELAPSLGISVDSVIHVNHQLRGKASDDDAEAVERLALRFGLPFVGVAVDAGAHARAHRCSVETAGHRVRQQVFARVREARGLDAVATGHSLDDQAETVLLRLVRGAGAHGLRGISPKRAGVIRPLLGTPRTAIEAYLGGTGVPVRQDASNLDLSIPRNRIRHELLPMLERYSPRIRESLARTAGHLAVDDDHFLDQVAAVMGRLDVIAGGVSLPLAALTGLSLPVRRRVALAVLKRLGAGETARRVESLAAALASPEGVTVTIGAISVSNSEGRIQVRRPGGRNGPPRRGIEQVIVGAVALVPGRVARFGPWEVAADAVAGLDPTRPAAEATVDADAVALPFVVRGRQPGDRVRPLGAIGRRKVQDILIDRKVPRASRATTPIVVDAQGRVVWVAGHVVAHDMRVTATTTRMLLLTLRPAGGAV